jgi:hypothetical protein
MALPEYLSSNAGHSYPSAASRITVVPGNSYVLGSYVEAAAAVPEDEMLHGITIRGDGFTGSYSLQFAVAVGAAGAESIIGWFRFSKQAPSQNGGGQNTVRSLVPIDAIPSGARIAVAAMRSGTGARNWTTGVRTLPKAFVGGTVTTTTNQTVIIPSAADGASITPSASTWADSAWAEVTAAAAADYYLNYLTLLTSNANGFQLELDVGVGAAGNETVITTFKGGTTGGQEGHPSCWRLPHLLDAIPSGARVAVRLRKGDTDTTAYTQACLGVIAKPL